MISQAITGRLKQNKAKMMKGTMVLRKMTNTIGTKDVGAAISDRWSELFCRCISVQLINDFIAEPESGFKGKLGKPTTVKGWNARLPSLKNDHCALKVYFEWEDKLGIPGAFLIKNKHQNEFFLVSLILERVPNHSNIHFVCNSWIYPASQMDGKDRIFFANKPYLPRHTPRGLLKYREEELESLRGDGEGKLKERDRIYDYDVYHDLGNPDESREHARPVLGRSVEFPYPCRGRTGRPPTKSDPASESRPNASSSILVPRDEAFTPSKLSEFRADVLKSVSISTRSVLGSVLGGKLSEFRGFEDVHELFQGGLESSKENEKTLAKTLKGMFQNLNQIFKFPVPQVIKENFTACMTDEEFAREMLAGPNPVKISCLKEFPPRSKLDSDIYGDQTSKITKEQLRINLGGLIVEQVIKDNKLFILDYHDAFMPYLRRINTTATKTYATRTILFLKNDGTLKPLAIELSKPHPNGDQFGAVSEVHLPSQQGIRSSLWKLAKVYVLVNDSGYHQLISHWLHTHAVIEPFVIATNRRLSVLHPIYKLLLPHFHDTMNINALARESLINADGIIELTFFTGKYSMEFTSMIYKNWEFPKQALPADLLERGMAVEDQDFPHGLRLVIKDYPYGVDGLDIWFAIETWVRDYCSLYYKTDEEVGQDSELQAWWKELVEVGHGDKKNEAWWPKMQTIEDLIKTFTIIIWIASPLHAAVNFGQYPYGGYILNRPTLTRQYMPEKGTVEYHDLERNLEKYLLKTITPKLQTLINISVIAILSNHPSDELYLGQRDIPDWTSDTNALDAFRKFGEGLRDIEKNIKERNSNKMFKNRYGPVSMPYTLLYPSSESGLTGKGIPNSISI